MNYFFDALRKYAVFSGRARRKEYWMFQLCYVVIIFIPIIIMIIFRAYIHDIKSFGGNLKLIIRIFELSILMPSIAVGIRRMHDIGKSGWYSLIPIYNIILQCRIGDTGANKYGPDPKQAATAL